MSVNKNVFASASERRNFEKLSRNWGNKYRIYHNLPFLNVFSPRDIYDFSDWKRARPIELTELEIARLKKTSIDYTICDAADSPLLCIEFDGLQQGFNVGTQYHPQHSSRHSVWRQEITELKLKVALGSLFPFVVVGSAQFADLSSTSTLTLVDGVIGEVLASRAVMERFRNPFDPNEIGMSQEEFDALPSWDQEQLVQDWVLSVEIDAEMEHNPLARERAVAMSLVQGYQIKPVHYPPVQRNSPAQRQKQLQEVVMNGVEVTIRTKDNTEVSATAWIPNFQVVGVSWYNVAENAAFLLAVEKLKRQSR